MNLIKYFTIILVIAVFVSCGKNSDSSVGVNNTISIDLVDSKSKDQLGLNIIDLKPIRMDSAFKGFSQRLRVKKIDGWYFVFDLEFQQLYCIDSAGNFKYDVGGLGSGPNELSGVLDFTYLDGQISFLIQAGDRTKIAQFDTLGNEMFRAEIDYPVSAFEQFGHNEYLLYTGWSNKATPYRLHKWDIQTGEDTLIFPHDHSEEKMPMEAYSLMKNDKGILFFDPLTPFVHQINSGLSISPSITFDLGKYRLDDDYWDLSVDEAIEALFGNGFYSCTYFVRSENYLAMLGTFVDEGGSEQERTLSIYNYKSNTIATRVLQPGTLDELALNVFSVEDKQMISLGDGYVLRQVDEGADLLERYKVSGDDYYLVYAEVGM
ncbi:6-bladed beta-propeller [Marinoscillum sp.]|uniref:6-bladed beta-propeller n=1 Tax=Marinoscillum sp. TaxID=2024838 RepID=UPI003BAC74D7